MSLRLEVDNEGEKASALAKACPVHKGIAVACCCAAIATLVPVALVQMKIMDDLPDPPGRFFDSKRVVTSKGAYRLGIPDGVLGLASYGVTLSLLMAAHQGRPLVRRALRAKLAWDATIAIRNVRKQITQHKSICSWCLGTAAATAGLVYFARRTHETEKPQTA
ncbi:MAG: vitamin K epoxide reductase family protein [Acidobacteriaceae bacterium]